MQDSVYFNRTKQNLLHLKQSLILSPIKYVEMQRPAFFRKTLEFYEAKKQNLKKKNIETEIPNAINKPFILNSLYSKNEKKTEFNGFYELRRNLSSLMNIKLESTIKKKNENSEENQNKSRISLHVKSDQFKLHPKIIEVKEKQIALSIPEKINLQTKRETHSVNSNKNRSEIIIKNQENPSKSLINLVDNNKNFENLSLSRSTNGYFFNFQNIPKKLLKKPKLSAKSWIIIETTHSKIIGSKKQKKTREIASLTKIMTCYIACSIIEKYKMDPNKYFVKVPRSAEQLGGTTASLSYGDKISIIDVLYGMMLPSGNDAALCISKFFGKFLYIVHLEKKEREKFRLETQNLQITFKEIYDKKWKANYVGKDWNKIFVCEMNKSARNLQLLNSSFSNPHGLSDINNKSTVEDIAKLSSKCLEISLFNDIVNCKEYSCKLIDKSNKEQIVNWKNTNELLWQGFNGIKTGNTTTAGSCLAASFKNNDLQYIIIILKTKSVSYRFDETLKLLKWILKHSGVKLGVLN